MASTPLQYRSHIERNLGWPVKAIERSHHFCREQNLPATSHILSVTLPFLTFRKLKATVGTTFSLHCSQMRHEGSVMEQLTWPDVTTLTKDVFPEALLECGRCWGCDWDETDLETNHSDFGSLGEEESVEEVSVVDVLGGHGHLPTKPV